MESEHYELVPCPNQFRIKESLMPSFTQDLAQVTTEMESLTQKKVSGKIIGVQHASKSLSCTSCKKKVTVKSNGKIANCQSCKISTTVADEVLEHLT